MNKGTILATAILCALLACAFFADWLSPRDPISQDLNNRFRPPTAAHWLGTDNLGRDMWSRVVYGSRISLAVGLGATLFALLAGSLVGLVSGFYGGWIDHGFMGLMEVLMAFPSILLAISIVAILGPSLSHAAAAIGIVAVPLYARVARSQVLLVKELEYVQAARAIGSSDLRILFRHILPNSLPALIVQAALGIGGAILDLAGLSFLGLGARPPMPEWGSMLSDTVRYLGKAPWIIVFPGIAISAAVLAFNLIGDALRDRLDPRTRAS